MRQLSIIVHTATFQPACDVYDAGTLTPIVKDPDRALMSNQVSCSPNVRVFTNCCHELSLRDNDTSHTRCIPKPCGMYCFGHASGSARSSPCTVPPTQAVLLYLQMRSAVQTVAGLFPTSIISGRGREKVEGFVKLKELFYAGSHGMDIVGPQVCLQLPQLSTALLF